MPFVSIPQGLRVTLEFELDGQLVLNVYYVTKSSPIISADLTTIAAIFKDWWIGDTRSFLSGDLSLERIGVTDMSEEDGEQIVYTTDLPAIGDNAGEATPNNVAFVVSRLSGFAGRSSRGRVYIAGLLDASITNNTVNGTVQAGLVAAHNSLNTAILTAGFIPVTASFIDEGQPRPFALTRVITSWAANNRVDTQRRRLPGVGT